MFLSKYGVARHIILPVVKRAVVDFAVSADWTPAAGDVKISKDGGAAANVTNLPTAIAMGNTAIWDFSLTATEMQAAVIVVTVADAATKAVEDQAFIIETYGNASAQHEFDLDTPTVVASSVSALANDVITAASIATDAIGSAELAASAVTEIQTGLATAAALSTVDGKLPAALVGGRIDASVGAMASDVITAAAVATDALGALELAAGAATEIATAVWAQTMAELSGVPAPTDSVLAGLEWLVALSRNKRTQSATSETLFKDNGATTLATSAKSDAAGVFTRGKYT